MRAGPGRAALGLTVAVLAVAAARTVGALEVPPLRTRVTDLAGVLEPREREALERKLGGYEQRSGHQLAVLIVPTLEQDSLEEYAVRVFESWQLGKRGRDDGVLMLIALAERQVRLEVGYGLEGEITDALSAQVIRNVVTPAFRQRDFHGGIDRALDLLMRAAGGEDVSVPDAAGRRPPASVLGWLLFVLIATFLLRGRGGRWFLLGSLLGGGWSSGSRRGGGGGFGGFGGGGGRSGGGGASGGW